MAFVFPIFKIGRCINRVSVTFVQHHHPMFGRSIPEHFRVTSQYVGQLINAGRIDELGLLKRGTVNVGKANGRSRAVTIDGVGYESVTAARKALGLSRDKIKYLMGKRQISSV